MYSSIDSINKQIKEKEQEILKHKTAIKILEAEKLKLENKACDPSAENDISSVNEYRFIRVDGILHELPIGKEIVIIEDTRYVKIDEELLPIINPQYGGVLYFMKDIKIGSKFYVQNGSWTGLIVEHNGRKMLKIDEDNELKEISPDYYNWIEFEDEKK